MLVWWIIQMHNDSDRIHCFTPHTKQAGTQNNIQLLQLPKIQYVRRLKSYSTCILECRSHPCWLCGSGYNNQWKTPYVTWCNNSQEDSEDAFCKAWSFQHDNATYTPYKGHMSCCSNFNVDLWMDLWTIYPTVPNLPHWIIFCLGHWCQTVRSPIRQ
jgi:hypothetical protein